MQNPVATELFAYIEDKLQESTGQEKMSILRELFLEIEKKYEWGEETDFDEEDEDEESAGADL